MLIVNKMTKEESFKLDSARRLQEDVRRQDRIKRLVQIEEQEVFVPLNTVIPYTPPKTVWKPNTATLWAFTSQCIKSIVP